MCYFFGCYIGKYWMNMVGWYLCLFYVFCYLLIFVYSWVGCISVQVFFIGVLQFLFFLVVVVYILRREQQDGLW